MIINDALVTMRTILKRHFCHRVYQIYRFILEKAESSRSSAAALLVPKVVFARTLAIIASA
jgi:hypothetical protein